MSVTNEEIPLRQWRLIIQIISYYINSSNNIQHPTKFHEIEKLPNARTTSAVSLIFGSFRFLIRNQFELRKRKKKWNEAEVKRHTDRQNEIKKQKRKRERV